MRKTFSSLIEWRDMLFFYCNEEIKAETINILTERELLKPDGKPNTAIIAENANFFGTSLAERLSTSRTVKIIGLPIIKSIMDECAVAKDYKSMYHFVVYMYGITRWRTPYNLQRIPVCPAAFKAYMLNFYEAFAQKSEQLIAEIPDTESEESEEISTEDNDETNS